MESNTMSVEESNLKRPINPMPDFVLDALKKRNLVKAYKLRPSYQRNDYIGWKIRAKPEDTKKKRLNQMLDELESGDKYMNMNYNSKIE